MKKVRERQNKKEEEDIPARPDVEIGRDKCKSTAHDVRTTLS